MLRSIVERIEEARKVHQDLDYIVFDDGSDFEIGEVVPYGKYSKNPENGGKLNYWRHWDGALYMCKRSTHKDFVFMPDDFLDLDIDALLNLSDCWEGLYYSMNLINDGRVNCWGSHRMGIKPIAYKNRLIQEVGFCDCGFMTNRKVLESLEIKKPFYGWFDQPDKSSGVGYQLTKQMRALEVPMLSPDKSFASHGLHDSVMHGDHRKEITLKSK